jgi:hypothetical protein
MDRAGIKSGQEQAVLESGSVLHESKAAQERQANNEPAPPGEHRGGEDHEPMLHCPVCSQKLLGAKVQTLLRAVWLLHELCGLYLTVVWGPSGQPRYLASHDLGQP